MKANIYGKLKYERDYRIVSICLANFDSEDYSRAPKELGKYAIISDKFTDTVYDENDHTIFECRLKDVFYEANGRSGNSYEPNDVLPYIMENGLKLKLVEIELLEEVDVKDFSISGITLVDSRTGEKYEFGEEILNKSEGYRLVVKKLDAFHIGETYQYSYRKNYKKAAEWYQVAIKQGSVDAMLNLGILYYNGTGVDQDYKKAFELFSKPAEQGDALAQRTLAFCYRDGGGVEQNIDKALEWFEKAAEQDDEDALLSLGVLYYEGKLVKQDYERSLGYFYKSYKNIEARYYVGLQFAKGLGVEMDPKRAFSAFLEAAKNDHADAMFMVGKCFEDGFGEPQDCEAAMNWYKNAAAAGHEEAKAAYERLKKQNTAQKDLIRLVFGEIEFALEKKKWMVTFEKQTDSNQYLMYINMYDSVHFFLDNEESPAPVTFTDVKKLKGQKLSVEADDDKEYVGVIYYNTVHGVIRSYDVEIIRMTAKEIELKWSGVIDYDDEDVSFEATVKCHYQMK